jgi:hypothetical protein
MGEHMDHYLMGCKQAAGKDIMREALRMLDGVTSILKFG